MRHEDAVQTLAQTYINTDIVMNIADCLFFVVRLSTTFKNKLAK